MSVSDLAAKVHSSFQVLSKAASELNTASDQLGKPISEIDSALKRLNRGISTWVSFETWEDAEDGSSRSNDIGYSKIAGRWGLSLRTVSSRLEWPEDEIEEWPFNDAPRFIRVSALEKFLNCLKN